MLFLERSSIWLRTIEHKPNLATDFLICFPYHLNVDRARYKNVNYSYFIVCDHRKLCIPRAYCHLFHFCNFRAKYLLFHPSYAIIANFMILCAYCTVAYRICHLSLPPFSVFASVLGAFLLPATFVYH